MTVDRITFAKQEWIVLDRSTGHVMRKEPLEQIPFDTNFSNIFNPSRLGNVGHWLNETYYNTFTEEEKEQILSHSWGIGGLSTDLGGRGHVEPKLLKRDITHTEDKEDFEGDELAFIDLEVQHRENAKKVVANIGLLSVSEWRAFSKAISPDTGILENPKLAAWTRTPVVDREINEIYAWHSVRNGKLFYSFVRHTLAVVHPVLFLNLDSRS